MQLFQEGPTRGVLCKPLGLGGSVEVLGSSLASLEGKVISCID